MANYTDEDLALMHTEGIQCPDDDDCARVMYAALDEVDSLLRQLGGECCCREDAGWLLDLSPDPGMCRESGEQVE